jgi:hypothetical protein
MMSTLNCRSCFLGLLLAASVLAAAGAEPPDARGPSSIQPTQLTLRLDPMQGRATVIGISEETLTIMTAAHFLAPEDVGRTILIRGVGSLRGELLAVTRNPGFQVQRSRTSPEPSAFGTLGVDTAIAVIKVQLRRESERRAFAQIRSAELTSEPIPGRAREILTVNIVDQSGREHVVRAGNHLNPKCLAWGRQGYDTQRGDSGAGVFYLRKTPDGESRPILIGNVAQTDDRGGLATLVSRGEGWVRIASAGPAPEAK